MVCAEKLTAAQGHPHPGLHPPLEQTNRDKSKPGASPCDPGNRPFLSGKLLALKDISMVMDATSNMHGAVIASMIASEPVFQLRTEFHL